MRHTRSIWTASVATALGLVTLLGTSAALEQASPVVHETDLHLSPVEDDSTADVAGALAIADLGTTTAPEEQPTTADAAVNPDRTGPNRPDAAKVDDARHELERLRLECNGVVEERGPGIVCRWTASASPRFAGYRLLRGDGDERQVIFRTPEIDHTWFFDDDVERGVEYHYLVQVLDPSGRVIGASNPASASVPDRPIERIELACERVGTSDRSGVGCRWSAASREDAKGYKLVRSIDGGARETIFRKGIDGPNHYVDAPLRGGHRYTYAVLVLDGHGSVIGEGGPVTVGWPPDPAPTDAPAR